MELLSKLMLSMLFAFSSSGLHLNEPLMEPYDSCSLPDQVLGTYAVVYVAVLENYCDEKRNHLGYYVNYGDSHSSGDIDAIAKNQAMRNYPQATYFSKSSSSSYPNMVIIQATTTKLSCTVTTYGIGFGSNEFEALDKAKSDLSGKNWSWNKSTGSYTILENRILF